MEPPHYSGSNIGPESVAAVSKPPQISNSVCRLSGSIIYEATFQLFHVLSTALSVLLPDCISPIYFIWLHLSYCWRCGAVMLVMRLAVVC